MHNVYKKKIGIMSDIPKKDGEMKMTSKDIVWYSTKEKLPDEFVSVLIYMPEEAPLPTVHEGQFISLTHGM